MDINAASAFALLVIIAVSAVVAFLMHGLFWLVGKLIDRVRGK